MEQKIIMVKPDYDKHAVDWEESGVNQKSYCLLHSLKYGHFVEARQRLQASRGKSRAKKNKKTLFTELRPRLNNPPALIKYITMHLPSETQLNFPTDLPIEQLTHWLSVVAKL